MECQQVFLSKKIAMHRSCNNLRRGYTDECDAGCEYAITDLLNSYNGSEGLFTCDCNDTQMFYSETECEVDRIRLRTCKPLSALLTPVSPCIARSQDCEAEPGCKARLDAYLESCNPEQTNPEIEPCSEECIGTLEALYDETLAQNFWECSCDDQMPKKWCRTSPSTYQVLCDMQSQLMSTSRSPQVPYKPLTTKAPTTSPATKDGADSQKASANDDGKGPGSAAPSINIRTIYQIALVVSVYELLHHIL